MRTLSIKITLVLILLFFSINIANAQVVCEQGMQPRICPGLMGGPPGPCGDCEPINSSSESPENNQTLGSYGCGNPDKRTHVNCLRGLLSSTPYGLTVQQSSPSKDGLGNYGCGNKNKKKHTRCLRLILDEHGEHLQVGNRSGGPPGTHSSVGISHCLSLPPDTRPQCEAEAHGSPGNHPPAAPGMAPRKMANGHENTDGNSQGGKSYCDRTPDDPHCNDNRNYMPEECKKEGDKPSWC
jgi:hypothetical protein